MTADNGPETPHTNRLTSVIAGVLRPDPRPLSDDWAGFGPPVDPGEVGTFGAYRVVRACGRGGMGAVYEAIDTTLRRTVALKLMYPHLTAGGGKERFAREAQAAAALRHENVVTLFHVGEHGGVPFLTTEFLTGSHLGEYAKNGLRVAEAVRVGREVAAGLAAAHAAGVVHRDIKPDNIWVEQPSGKVRLLDFGLAWVGEYRPRDGPSSDHDDPRLTGAGHFVGTPGYVAPEQIDARPADHRADLFSLGAVLYRMVAGRPAFAGRTIAEVAEAETSGQFVPVPDLRPDVPPKLAELIHGLLSPDPADRPASAAAVEQELLVIGTQLLASTGELVLTPLRQSSRLAFDLPAESAGPKPVRQTRWILPLAATVLLAVGAVVAVVAVWPDEKPEERKSRPGPAPVPPAVAPPPNPLAGFTGLIPAKGFDGWSTPAGQVSDRWSNADGVFVAADAVGRDQYLLTDREYADFDLRLDYRWPKPGGHTTLMLRAWETKAGAVEGLALNLGDDEGFPKVHGRDIGNLYRTGTIQYVTSNPPPANKPIGEWNALRVVARRSVFEVWLNGVAMPTADLDAKVAQQPAGARPVVVRSKGSVGLLAHWGPVEFRRVAIK